MQQPRWQLKKNGAVVVRKFLTGAETAELQSVVRAIYEAMAEIGTFVDADMENHFRRWNGVWLEHLPSLLEAYDRNLAARYRRVVELIERRTQRVFGDGWHFFALRSFLRRLSGTNGILRWHIDADAAATSWGHCINVWLPLDAVGTDRPSVDVILGSHIKMRELPPLSGDSHDRDDTFVASIGPTTSSGLNPSDALVFDHYTLHRTQPWRAEKFSRTACELRFFFEAPILHNLKKLHGALPAPLKRATARLGVAVRRGFVGDAQGGMAR
jgi:hypothetical protein